MIKVVLRGNSGNQMFQYAIGRFLAYKHHCSLYIDISNLRKAKKKYILPRFNIVGKTVNPLPSLIVNKIFRTMLWKYSFSPIYFEKGYNFDESVLFLPNPCTLFGYFQSEKYFKPISDIIRNDLSLENFLTDNATSEIERQILNSNSVSVHVRRKDYLNSNRSNVCSIKYYDKAMRLIREKVDNPSFFVFSDDIQWCIDHFRDSSCVFVDLEQSRNDPLNDMRLMSLCKHNIIANSSFSWWGAWLNNYPQKSVVYPYMWFNDKNVSIEDRACEGWSKIIF